MAKKTFLTDEDEKRFVKKVNGQTPDENGNVEIEVSGGNADQMDSIFTGKTASFYGDSLTEVNYHYKKGYHQWVKEILGLKTYANYGSSGSTVASVYNRVNSVTDMADVVFVMCGVNDQNFSVPLGALGDTTTDTTYGALDMLCGALKRKYPLSIVVFITPHYQTKYPHRNGITSYEVSKAIREVCEKYTIPVYDNFILSGIYVTNLSTFTTDNCHWNDVAHEMVGKNLANFMKDTFGYIHGYSAGGNDHAHSYNGTVTKDATCTTAGTKMFTCECGDSYTESIPATGHKWNDGVVTVEPTGTTQGVKTYTCTVCGETRTETIPAIGHEHNHVSTVVAPTCTEQGFTEHVCECGDRYKDTYVSATGHTEVIDNAVAATCTTTGLTEGKHCSVCGEVLVAQKTVSATGHNYVDGVCTHCGASDPNYVKWRYLTADDIESSVGATGLTVDNTGTISVESAVTWTIVKFKPEFTRVKAIRTDSNCYLCFRDNGDGTYLCHDGSRLYTLTAGNSTSTQGDYYNATVTPPKIGDELLFALDNDGLTITRADGQVYADRTDGNMIGFWMSAASPNPVLKNIMVQE